VVLIEAGPASVIDTNGIGFEPVFTVDDYPGATIGRYFGMGGSTGRWGGLLIPYTRHDLRCDFCAGVWDHIVDCVERHTPMVLRQLGYRKGSDFADYARQKLGSFADILAHAGLDVQASLLLPYLRKNLLCLLSEIPKSKPQPRVFFNAVAKDWSVQGGQDGMARLAGLVAVSRNRNSMTVTAGKYILAAGAIESTRILLEIDQSGSQSILSKSSAPGCFLADHLSLSIADVAVNDSETAANLFAYRFDGAWMRGIRLLECRPANNPPAFAHFDFEMENAGFKLAKELLWAVQGRHLPVLTAKSVAAGLGDLMKLAYHQYIRSRLYIPKNSTIYLQLDMEQHPVRENRISLSPLRDEYGRQRAEISWHISDQDMVSLSEIAGRLLQRWPGRAVGLPDLIPRELGTINSKPYDAYHPVGTCRMGEDDEAVVDLNLKVRGIENIWVVSTGVFPGAGTANPTFSMLCLANELVDQFD